MKKYTIMLGLCMAGLTQEIKAFPNCNYPVALSGDISGIRNLSADTLYQVNGLVRITGSGILNVAAGTVIEFTDSSRIIALKGTTVNINGTASAPVVFTTGAASAGSRPHAVNAGIAFIGDAPVNMAGLPIPDNSTLLPGNNSHSAAGSIHYLQMSYLDGFDFDRFRGPLVFAGVGDSTQADHIQVSQSSQNGIVVIGGKFDLNNTVIMDNKLNGLDLGWGTQVSIQGLLSIQKDMAAHASTGDRTNALYVYNNKDSSWANPYTQVNLNNSSLTGITFFNGPTGISADFRDGISIGDNGRINVQNSVITGFQDNGLYLRDADAIAKTGSGDIKVSYSSFTGNGADYNAYPDAVTGWNTLYGGCSSTMEEWLFTAPATSLCRQQNNQRGNFNLGYDGSFQNDYCSTSPSLLLTENTDLSAPNTASIYDNRGCIQEDNLWEWVDFCSQNSMYCSESLTVIKANQAFPETDLSLTPNPAAQSLGLSFNAAQTGPAFMRILDAGSAKTVFTDKFTVRETGRQYIPLSVASLKTGIYMVQIQFADQFYTRKLVVIH